MLNLMLAIQLYHESAEKGCTRVCDLGRIGCLEVRPFTAGEKARIVQIPLCIVHSFAYRAV